MAAKDIDVDSLFSVDSTHDIDELIQPQSFKESSRFSHLFDEQAASCSSRQPFLDITVPMSSRVPRQRTMSLPGRTSVLSLSPCTSKQPSVSFDSDGWPNFSAMNNSRSPAASNSSTTQKVHRGSISFVPTSLKESHTSASIQMHKVRLK